MTTQLLLSAAPIAIVIALVLWRQLATRPLRDNPFKVPAVVGVLGLYQLAPFVWHGSVPLGQWVALVVALVAAGLIAVPRADSYRLWPGQDGMWLRSGTMLTLLLWLAAFGLHAVSSTLVPRLFGVTGGAPAFDSASMFVYIAVSLGVQGVRLDRRRRALRGDTASVEPRRHESGLLGFEPPVLGRVQDVRRSTQRLTPRR